MLASWDNFKHVVNTLAQPFWLISLTTLVFALILIFYRQWTRPWLAAGLLLVFCGFYFGSMADPNYRRIVAKPDNVPITMMVLSVFFFLWLSLRRAALNDTRIEQGLPLLEEPADDKVLVWPDLVYIELIAMVIGSAILIVWGIVLKAPLEQPANPSWAPNPAKAPWYFLGLQEMLVYFDAWMAGVVYPSLIILGLMAIPYIDTNPRGSGYYTFKERRFAIVTYLFGFLILWVLLIFIGTFLRGPNWGFFGPYERWDIHKAEALNNIDLSNVWWNFVLNRARPMPADYPNTARIWIALYREWLGLVLVFLFFVITPVAMRLTIFKKRYGQMGALRYNVMMILLLFMALMPIKMVLRWLFNLKYFIWLPEYQANL